MWVLFVRALGVTFEHSFQTKEAALEYVRQRDLSPGWWDLFFIAKQ